MAKTRPLALVFALIAATVVGGCMINPRYFSDQHSTTQLTDGRLEIALAPEKSAQLGGKGSAQLDSFIRTTVTKERVCPNGFTTAEPVPVRGCVSIIVKCGPERG